MPLQATSGAASYDGFGGGVVAEPNYIESVFSTYLYTGNGSTQTITNNIDLSTKGGMVWLKNRSSTYSHRLFDTTRGATQAVASNTTDEQFTQSGLTAFNTTGFDIGSAAPTNDSGLTFASWTFRKQPKFFDVVTFVKDSSTNQRISHSLDSVPACIIVKRVTSADDWYVYHRSLGGLNKWISLNSTGAVSTTSGAWGSSNPTTTDFGVSTNLLYDGGGTPLTYVAYVFAHDAGGFGLTGTDNVISCGSYTGTSSTPNNITLGFEPQWLLIKNTTDGTQEWGMFDNMRGLVTGTGGDAELFANTSDAENVFTYFRATATGFACEDVSSRYNNSGNTYIYIAIRRGPMKVPTSGTSVFSAKTMTATRANLSITGVGFSPDMVINGVRSTANYGQQMADRLRGVTQNLFTEYNFTEYTYSLTALKSLDMDGISIGTDAGDASGWNFDTGDTSVKWMFKRAPSVFDIVCYTGTQTAGQTFSHNLGAVPEMMLVKSRSGSFDWQVYHSALGASKRIYINSTLGASSNTSAPWNDTTPTSTIFTLGNASQTNGTGDTFVNYLFATCAGVSKVGSYTGTGALQTINCGFTSGARFILIKRTDSTGDWFTYDSTRGITSGNDPYMRLNSAAVEVTGTNYVDTDTTGFQVTAAAPAGLNANGGTFIFLAIA